MNYVVKRDIERFSLLHDVQGKVHGLLGKRNWMHMQRLEYVKLQLEGLYPLLYKTVFTLENNGSMFS